MNDLIIIGSGGFGREVAWLVERINESNHIWNILGFIDDDLSKSDTTIGGYPVIGDCSEVKNFLDAYYVCAVGASNTKRDIVGRIKQCNPSIKFATLIDPSVLMSGRVSIGEGTIICAGTILTVDIDIGSHVIINLDSTIGHDATIKDYVTIYPSVNVSGATIIGECVELGTGLQIIQGKMVGDRTIVGAGAVVVKDLPADCTAVGSPAKPIKYHK